MEIMKENTTSRIRNEELNVPTNNLRCLSKYKMTSFGVECTKI